MHFRWSIAPVLKEVVEGLSPELKVPRLMLQCVANRGLTDAEAIMAFLEPRLKGLADPFLIPELTEAVDRLWKAIADGEHMVLFGDYDVDGVTSTALLAEVLIELGGKIEVYLPHRMDEGYGLSLEAAQNCLGKFPGSVLVAVDCGSNALESIAWLAGRGVDVIVLDHHQVSDPLPRALALVNPRTKKGEGKGEPQFSELCSVGLAFKLSHGLVKRGREMGIGAALNLDLRRFLDLVALGTIADLVPLVGENRILVSAGLQRLNVTTRPGLVALKRVAQVEQAGVHEVGFQLAPRLNAAGRLENAEAALQLVRCTDAVMADRLARALDTQNRERQQIEARILDEVVGLVRSKFKPETDYVIVEGQLPWHIGVVGIVAARVLREFQRPAIILGGDGEQWRGSGRSIEGFDLAMALRQCADLLVRHGGHAMAAGVTLRSENVDLFRARLNELARAQLTRESFQPVLRLDAEVTLGELDLELMDWLERVQPVGQGNRPIQLMVSGVRQGRPCQRMGRDRQHVKMWITDGRKTHPAVWWNAADKTMPEGRFDLAFMPQSNEYNGRRELQLKVLDWRPAKD